MTIPFSSATKVPLGDRPDGATHARVTITALTPGSLVWGTDAGGNNPSGSWGEADVAGGPSSPVWYDFQLNDSVDKLYLEPTGLEAIATVQYITITPTRYEVNANGETYGAGNPEDGELDLVFVGGLAPDGGLVDGYARTSDLTDFSPDHSGQPKNPTQAVEWQRERDEKYPDGWTVPVYESDGVTVIGEFRVG
ncbi:hypothetical protein ACFUTX_08910 [Microbacterium sp. NPDC057407]|uniref:hypothetical protein n=1 Tax=Microbacterium sp. NPDC057407 TaxID=3346120 RepID=UPI00366D7E21